MQSASAVQSRIIMATSSKRHGSSSGSKAKQAKRQVSKDAFLKWQCVNESDHQSLTWLQTDMDDDDRSLVTTLWCAVCRKHEPRICWQKNFSRAWIEGSTNQKTSNITDHANSEQHKSAMALLRKDQAKSKNKQVTSYSPIAHSLLSTGLNPAVREQMKKFEVSFVLAKEHIPFSKYPAILALEEKHGVDLVTTYNNRDSAGNFVHYIAESQQNLLHAKLESCHFYSVLINSSTDKGRVENELFVIFFVKKMTYCWN